MSFATFERLPRRLGWKHEYYGGKTHITPSKTLVNLVLDLTPRATVPRTGIRPVTLADQAALEAPFLAAFAAAPEFADYPPDRFRKTAAEYLRGFFGTVRGAWSPVSVVAHVGGRIVGAALVKQRPAGALLDCLFVRPSHARRGWATALVSHGVEGLSRLGETQLRSCVLLANEPSLAWHLQFGFQELPDLWVASSRLNYYHYELDRHRRLGDLSDPELQQLEAQASHWWDEVRRLREVERKDFGAAHLRVDLAAEEE
jgi:GNAT superfamily N-acetyltransferase